MAISNRPYDSEGNREVGRRVFRSLTDFRRPTKDRGGNNNRYNNSNKPAPPESTNAENFYYLKQMNSKTPMVIVMTDGEEIRGWIEWYDKSCLKVNREGGPNLLIQKHCIKYVFKQDEQT